MKHVTPRAKFSSQPHNPADVVVVEDPTQGVRRRGTAAIVFSPASQVGDTLAAVETEEINFVHGGTGSFDSNYLHAFVQSTDELESEVDQL